jgi:signal transduction histidine kinase
LDTKLKRSNAFKLWLCFFIGINILGLFIIGGLTVIDDFDIAMLGGDLKETQSFKHNLAAKFDTLARHITHNLIPKDMDENNQYVHLAEIKDEGENLIYYAKNPKTQTVLTNMETDSIIDSKDYISLPEGYDYYIYYDGERFIGQKDGKPLDIYKDRGYRNTLLRLYLEKPDSYLQQGSEEVNQYRGFYDIPGCQILLAVKKDIVENPYGYSSLYSIQRKMNYVKGVMVGALIVFALGVGLLVLSIIKRKYIKEFEKLLGKLLGKVFLEFKIPVLIIAFLMFWILAQNFYSMSLRYTILLAMALWWFLYAVWIDLSTNGINIFYKNFINALIQWYKGFERKYPFQKALLVRLYTLVGLELLLIFLTVLFLMMAHEISILFALVFIALGFYIFYRYARRYANTIDDMGKIIDQTHLIKRGDTSTKLQLNPHADLFGLAENLNTIQDGIAEAVSRSVKSERMKVELITNVSHDLKTPLTSIISYVDLLSKEEGLSEHVKDYIRILALKSERLKILIQDLFDLSKAVSGEMEFEKKPLDLGKLIEQTLADLDDRISESRLIFKVNIPEGPVPIISDGNKLYRVFLNLFNNALKYSLAGTRVYVDLETTDKKAIVSIKNIANYEMNFSEEEIMERFVRGDKARSSEGSGLGLAIAQNFTQACGGDFEIKIDGDLFKVMLSFDRN